MPKRTDLKKILIIGSGPIVIGQACEFDYSGTQACRTLKEDGFFVILLNSNPATIMTDPEVADKTYIEPITVPILEKIIAKERPDAVLPTLGGQTALNISFEAARAGIFKKYKVEMLGATEKVIARAEDRELFKEAMKKTGVEVAKSKTVYNMDEAIKTTSEFGFPLVIRPAFTLAGTGGGIAYNFLEFKEIAENGLKESPINEILVEEGLLGWKEYELEVMRDKKDNVIIVCSIENFDPMGVHTGDSITVAPQQTLTDKEYQNMRSLAISAIRAIGVETGGSNVQFAVNPIDGRIIIIEINPRVSRSSALASKATGFPIAKIAAKLAVGYTLDEIPNDITKNTPACFEPVIDYCVTKIPRFAFEKFPQAEDILTTSMKSVGEVMAIGRTFKESLQKGLRGLEKGLTGLNNINESLDKVIKKCAVPSEYRLLYVAEALRQGKSIDEINELTGIDRWFLVNISEIIDFEKELQKNKFNKKLFKKAKEIGFSNARILELTGKKELPEISCSYKMVDTCAAEFDAFTPYYYSTYEKYDESKISKKKKVMILGGGPNRIGQGIEFDYCAVHASLALREENIESIMVNCNPETVSTDYDISDKLYFEPITFEDVFNIIKKEKPWGVILQFGGQTPLNLAADLVKNKVNILGTDTKSIDRTEDREKFRKLLNKLNLKQAPSATTMSENEAQKIAQKIGYPIIVRPSYVLGGRAMEIAYNHEDLIYFFREAVIASGKNPVLIDKFLENAIEVDVDVIGDGKDYVIGGILEHIEEAGIHSGDSSMSFPCYSLAPEIVEKIRGASYALARELKIKGFMNIQYAVRENEIYVIEVNPRASRTVPFISKAIGVPLAKIVAKIMAGKSLLDLGFTSEIAVPYFCVKASVFPFNKFSGIDVVLGPEMKSTGEVMGIGDTFALAYAKSQEAAGQKLPKSGCVFISVKDRDKKDLAVLADKFVKLGFEIIATKGTAKKLKEKGIKVSRIVKKISEGRPNMLDFAKNKEVDLVINTPSGKLPHNDEIAMRAEMIKRAIPCITTISGAFSCAMAIKNIQKEDFKVKNIQEYQGMIKS